MERCLALAGHRLRLPALSLDGARALLVALAPDSLPRRAKTCSVPSHNLGCWLACCKLFRKIGLHYRQTAPFPLSVIGMLPVPAVRRPIDRPMWRLVQASELVGGGTLMSGVAGEPDGARHLPPNPRPNFNHPNFWDSGVANTSLLASASHLNYHGASSRDTKQR